MNAVLGGALEPAYFPPHSKSRYPAVTVTHMMFEARTAKRVNIAAAHLCFLNNPDRLCRLGILTARKQKASPNGACLEGSPD